MILGVHLSAYQQHDTSYTHVLKGSDAALVPIRTLAHACTRKTLALHMLACVYIHIQLRAHAHMHKRACTH